MIPDCGFIWNPIIGKNQDHSRGAITIARTTRLSRLTRVIRIIRLIRLIRIIKLYKQA